MSTHHATRRHPISDLCLTLLTQCWLWARETSEALSPMVVYEVLDAGGGKVGLRSLSSGKLLRAIPPGSRGPTWVVVVDGSDVSSGGAQFRLERGGDGVAYLYSEAARG